MDKNKQSRSQRMSPPDSINGLKVDPVANLIPMMTEEEFSTFYAKVKADGRIFKPVVLRDGKVAEGRHRLMAVEKYRAECGKELAYSTRDFSTETDGEITDFVLRENVHDRNLNQDQRAAAVVKVHHHRLRMEAEAAKAQSRFQPASGEVNWRGAIGVGDSPGSITVAQESGPPRSAENKSRRRKKNPTSVTLAALAKVSRNKIDQVLKVKVEAGEEAINRVFRGESTIRQEMKNFAAKPADTPALASLKDRVRKMWAGLKKRFEPSELEEVARMLQQLLRAETATTEATTEGIVTPSVEPTANKSSAIRRKCGVKSAPRPLDLRPHK